MNDETIVELLDHARDAYDLADDQPVMPDELREVAATHDHDPEAVLDAVEDSAEFEIDADADPTVIRAADQPGTGEKLMLKAAELVGSGIGMTSWFVLTLIPKVGAKMLFGLSRAVPGAEALWSNMTKTALYRYYKASGGDRVGLETLPSGRMELTPIKYRPPEVCERDEKPGWAAKGRDKVWRTTTDDGGPMLGKTPVQPLDSESWRSTTTYEATVAEAVDQGRTRPLYDVQAAELTAVLDAGPYGNQGQAAVADGGAQVADIEFDPRGSPIFDDTIIDLGGDEYDGQAVSWAKAKELFVERTTSDEMAMQEERGFLAGRSGKEYAKLALKLMLIAGAVAIAGLVGKELVAALFGGAGGGGGINPLIWSLEGMVG